MRTKKNKRSVFYRLSVWLHLWLGLVSGIVVVLVSLTAAALVFEDELRVWLQPYQTVSVPAAGNRTFLPPSVLSKAVMDKYKIPSVYGVFYRGEQRSATVPYYGDPSQYQVVYVNPYTAEVLKQQFVAKDFFWQMIVGHYELWLPKRFGMAVVSYGTLIFVITLFTGLVLWWPKKWNKSTRKQSFFIKVKGSFKRLNYDLHNVLGFYSLLIALILGLTGMMYGLKWFNKTVYFLSAKGQVKEYRSVKRNKLPVSDTTLVASGILPDEDRIFSQLEQNPENSNQRISILYPYGKTGVWSFGVNPDADKKFREVTSYYEQHSLKLLKKDPEFYKAKFEDQVMRVNYDLHVGAIGGMSTKILAFIACLISASLPITGFIIWWGKKKKSK